MHTRRCAVFFFVYIYGKIFFWLYDIKKNIKPKIGTNGRGTDYRQDKTAYLLIYVEAERDVNREVMQR